MTDKKKAALDGSFSQNTKPHHYNSSHAQRARIITHLLLHGSVSSMYAREVLDCYHPNPRIKELRNAGYSIVTQWTLETDSHGNSHRVGLWVLLQAPASGKVAP